MISIQLYGPSIHSEHISRWLRYRELDPKLVDGVPHLGYIAISDTGIGVAAGFLRMCEGNYAIIDGFITNPTCRPSDRNEALNLVTAKLVSVAKERNIAKLWAFTMDESILERAKKHGFAHMPHSFMVLEGNKE